MTTRINYLSWKMAARNHSSTISYRLTSCVSFTQHARRRPAGRLRVNCDAHIALLRLFFLVFLLVFFLLFLDGKNQIEGHTRPFLAHKSMRIRIG